MLEERPPLMIPNDKQSSRAPAIAPPPAPPLGAPTPTKEPGFNPSWRRGVLEVGAALGLLFVLGGLITFTGGRLAATLTPILPIKMDIALGKAASEQAQLEQEECTNPAAKKYVEEIASYLLALEKDPPFEFSFRVINEPSVNATALPGGYVTVHSGLLEAAMSGEEVAGVLAHELEHARARHGTRRILSSLGGRAALALILGGTDLHSYGQWGGGLAELSYGRDQEAEADELGLALLLQAGINPSGFSVLFERLAQEGLRPPEFLSTHPDPGERAARARKSVPVGVSYRKLPSPQGITCSL